MFKQLISWIHKGGKGINMKTSKKGDNYYCIFTIEGEVILTIISPPVTYGTKTDVNTSGSASVTGFSADVGVKYDKDIRYDHPIILFNSNNKAGLQLKDILPEVQENIVKNNTIQQDFKIDPSSLSQSSPIDVPDKKYVSIGSTLMTISNDAVVLRHIPFLSPEVKETIETILESLVKTLFDTSSNVFRANVMLYNPIKNVLKIVASYNMRGSVDEDIEIDVKHGGAGESFRENGIKIVDLVLKKHEEYGIEQKYVWTEMKSIISVPIHDKDGMIIGVLNIDSNMKYQPAGFDNDSKQNALRMQAKIISNVIEYTESVN